jgi:hypothetical protein
VAAARRAEALRAVLVRARLAFVARRVLVLVLVERAPAERLLPLVERFEAVERLRVVPVVELRRALLRVVVLFWVAIW